MRGIRHFELFNFADVVHVRQCARDMAREMGFGLTDQTRIATAISEVAHQVLSQQHRVDVSFTTVMTSKRRGLEFTCSSDETTRFSVSAVDNIAGGVKQLMDDFEVETRSGQGIWIVMRKWLEEAATTVNQQPAPRAAGGPYKVKKAGGQPENTGLPGPPAVP